MRSSLRVNPFWRTEEKDPAVYWKGEKVNPVVLCPRCYDKVFFSYDGTWTSDDRCPDCVGTLLHPFPESEFYEV